jgi:uncharacterized glyoxalase superfamily protein PhnB
MNREQFQLVAISLFIILQENNENLMNLRAIPTFRIFDYKHAWKFYIEGLGFKIDWEHRFGDNNPVYMQISRNQLTLHLSENQRFKAGTIVFVECEGLMELYTELSERVTKIHIPKPEKTPWNTLQMEVEDPFGNLLRFNENLQG